MINKIRIFSPHGRFRGFKKNRKRAYVRKKYRMQQYCMQKDLMDNFSIQLVAKKEQFLG